MATKKEVFADTLKSVRDLEHYNSDAAIKFHATQIVSEMQGILRHAFYRTHEFSPSSCSGCERVEQAIKG